MRILKLTAENIKKLRTVEITPTGDLVQITGANGSGKSSVLDAIYWALAGKAGITSQPVRVGEERAIVKLDLGEIVVTRRFGKDGQTSLVVEAADGEATFKSPQVMLDKMLGALTFDPLEFSRMPEKAQLAELRRVVAVDVDLDALTAANTADFSLRTEANRRVKALEVRIDQLGTAPAEVPVRIDVEALMERLTGVSDHNAKVATQRSKLDAWSLDADRFEQGAKQNRLEAARLVELADKQDADALKLRDVVATCTPEVGAPIDPGAIRVEIDQAKIANAAADLYALRGELNDQLATLEAHVTRLTAAMLTRTQARTAAIAAAHFPVEGLGFTDDGVTYNGLPFDQASSAEQLRVSVALAMAANPKLRVLRIKDGSLLDPNSLAMIATMAHESDYQIWIESVDTSGLIGIVMEDGSVKGAVVIDPDAPVETEA